MKIYHLIILDASGSMSSIYDAAFSGCNETIQSIRSIQKRDDNVHYLSLVTFNSTQSAHYVYDNVLVEQALDLESKDYVPDACTPLYDAIGLSILHLQDHLPKEDAYSVLVTIITDGEENSSMLFTQEKIKSLVEELKSRHWTFAYIGANQDEVMEAKKMGIHNTLHFDADEAGTKQMFSIANDAMQSYCCRMSIIDTPITMEDDFFDHSKYRKK